MSSFKKRTEWVNPSKIIGIQFSMLSPEEIRKNSVAEINKRDTYINNKPVLGGLFDPRMGVLEPSLICPTDGLTNIDTPGYFGHIELARPVFFIQHIKEIMKICGSVCVKCSKLLINKSQHTHIIDWPNSKKWDYVTKLCSDVRRCGETTDDGCGCRQPDKIRLEGFATILAIWEKIESNEDKPTNVTMKLIPELVLKIFKRISDEDVSFMGMNPTWSRPDWMICQVLPVPPPAVRPSVKQDAQQRSEDDLTHIYSNIIKLNNILTTRINDNAQQTTIDGLTLQLQYFIAMIVNNKVKGANPMSQRSGRVFQCIMGRINTKNGRIRGNLMGKRVDYSARSVITGDPSLLIKQLGVPMKVAKNLTKPIVVNDRNRDFLKKLVENGPDVHPGAKILELKSGEKIYLRYVDRSSIRLNNGDVVHRHMMDGDAVLFNRQPSLHRMSMMCHIAKIMPIGNTFRMNVACTKPYNADFDGDEMNMHLPQNIMAETELKNLAAIPYQIVSPASNSPIIGIFQDSMLGAFEYTSKQFNMTPREAMNLLMRIPNLNPLELFGKNRKTVTNFEVLSQITPPITIKYKTKMFSEDEDYNTSNNVVEIHNGKYIRGRMEKSVLGSTTKGIIHRAYNDFGTHAAMDYIDNIQSIVIEYMKTSSFSVGVSDLVSSAKTANEIGQTIAKHKAEIVDYVEKIHLGVFENNTASSNMEEFENTIGNILNKATDEMGKIGRNSLQKNNRFLTIVNSGSKGNMGNICNMISCLGQVNVDGKRIPYGFDGRTLPHFTKYDDSPGSRGFIENSYISGLTAPELFFHAMHGRIGLIDTAVKTSQTGYIQRRLIKGLEDLQIDYDGTVRNSKGKIIQFAYGDDGFESTKVEAQRIPLVTMSIQDIYMHYDIPGVNDYDKELINIYDKNTVTRIKSQREETRVVCKNMIDLMIKYQDDVVQRVFRYKNDDGVNLPVSFENIINNVQGNMGLSLNTLVDITPLETFKLLDEYYVKIKTIYYAQPNELFHLMYYYYLSPRVLLAIKRFHRKALTVLLETIVLKYKQALVHPGEMVGVIAGQSIGEPTTQLTLNTFHLTAGAASKTNVTRGVPRIEEILRLTQNPKNPSLTIHLKPQDETSSERAAQISNMLTHTKLGDVVSSVQICYDPLDQASLISEDKALLEQFYEFERIVEKCDSKVKVGDSDTKSPWILRLELDPEALLDKNITVDDINYAIANSEYILGTSCIFSDYNSDKLAFRIRVHKNMFSGNKKMKSLDQTDEIITLKNLQDNLLNKIVLRGISTLNNNKILSIYKARNTLIEHLENGGYDVSEYKEFSINEIDAMLNNNCLDMLVHSPENTKKTYVTWFLSGKAKPSNIENTARELFDVEGTLTRSDTLVIIANEPANKGIEAKIKYLYDRDGIFIVYYYLRQLQFNILTHSLVPECKVMKDSEVEDFKKKYNIKHLAKLPEISRFDPMAQALQLRPGQVCKILRSSPTAIKNEYYRICV